MLLTWLQPTPGWVLPGASLDMYFAAGTYYPAGVDSLLTVTRAQTVSSYAQTTSGSLTAFAANTPRITDQGLLVEEARTNLALQSQTFSNASWTKASVTITGAAGVAPDGTTTASRAVYVGGLGTPDSKRLDQDVTISGGTANKAFSNAFWVRSNTGSSQALRLKNTHGGVIDSFSAITATTAWQRFTFAVTNDSNAGNGLQNIGIVAAAADTAFDVLIWQGQMENSTFNTSDIPTTTVAVARAADAITAVVTAANLTIGSAFVSALWPTFNGTANVFIEGNSGTAFKGLSLVATATTTFEFDQRNGATSGGRSQSSATIAFSIGQAFKAAMSWDSAAAPLFYLNGAAQAAGATPSQQDWASSLSIGSRGGGNSLFADTYIKRIAIFYNNKLSAGQLAAITT